MRKTLSILVLCALLSSVAAVAQTKLAGSVIHASDWTGSRYTDPYGLYEFDADAENLSVAKLTSSWRLENNTCGVTDGDNVYLFNVEMELEDGDTYVSGSVTKVALEDYGSYTFGRIGSVLQVPTALTWDASTSICYGCFYDKDGTGFEFGTMSLSGSLRRDKISKLRKRMVAMADDDNGTVWGIDEDGTLQKINVSTGALTEVGPTGVTPSTLVQSACYVDGKIYWAAQVSEQKSLLYVIDPQTGKATLKGDFPKAEQFSTLYKKKPLAEDGAPAAMDDLEADFEGASLTGTLSFTLPTLTFGGSDLTGQLAWTVTKDGETLASGTGQPGEKVTTAPVTLDNDYNALQLYSSNDAGRSPVYKASVYVGPDTPSSIPWGEPTLVIDSTGKATVTWPAVTTGQNDGYIDPAQITYTITRNPDGVVVAEGYKETTYSEQLPVKQGITSYSYSIKAVFMGNEGSDTETNKVKYGSGWEVPYTETFDYGALDNWTVLDQNGDYMTWYEGSDNVYSQSGAEGGNDEWLISPDIHLVPGKYYKVSFRYWSGLPGYDDYAGQAFEAGFGQGTDPSSFQILGSKSNVALDEDAAKTFSTTVKVDADGQYNFGIHDVSPQNAYLLYIDDFTVEEGGTLEVPAQVSDFAAVADAQGALSVTISLTAPSLTAEGKALTDLQRVEIIRDDTVTVKTFTGPQPGEKLTFTDTEATGLTDGSHHYAVHSVNAKGQSLDAEADVVVGIKAPAVPTDFVATEQTDGVHLTWTAPVKDADGNTIDPKDVVYDIYAVKYYTSEYLLLQEDYKGTSYVDGTFLNADDQLQVYYIIQAKNRAGVSDDVVSNQFIVGNPYTLPFHENFSPEYARQSKNLWWINLTEDINTMSYFSFIKTMSSDGDNGCAYFPGGGTGVFTNLRSGKIDMRSVEKPQITFDYYVAGAGEDVLTLEYSTDLKAWKELTRIDWTDLDVDGATWLTHTADLTECASYPYVYLRFHGEADDLGTPIAIDNIHIGKMAARDLAVTLSTPQSVVAGRPASATVTVFNHGSEAASTYTVTLYVGDEAVAEKTGASLEAQGKESLTFDFTPSVCLGGESVDAYAYVEFSGDENPDDNTSSTKSMRLKENLLPVVTSLTGDVDNAGNARLSWSAPAAPEETVTETFEDYNAFLTDGYGAWTTRDADGLATLAPYNCPFPHAGEPYAWITFNPSEAGIDLDNSSLSVYVPHSGDQYLASFGLTSDFNANEDWLISPELSGKEQTVSFWAVNFDSENVDGYVELYYSTTDRSDAAWQKAKPSEIDLSGSWEKFEFTVPEGAKYFAVCNITNGATAVFLDDITYSPARKSPDVKGYRVYRDGKFVAQTEGAGYTDTAMPAGEHRYSVTAVYDGTESMPVSVVLSNGATSIGGVVVSADHPQDVFSVSGQLVRRHATSLRGLPMGVYIVDGRKVTVK